MMKKTIIISLLCGFAIFTDCKNEAPQASPTPPPVTAGTPDTIPPAVDDTIQISPSTESPSGNAGTGVKDKAGDMAKPAKVTSSESSTPPGRPHASTGSARDFSDLASLDPSILLEIRYATTNNFMKAQIYDCPRCLLRPEAAKAIVRAQKALKKRGLGLKMFDCYRPSPYQQRLWDKVPDPDYVTPPSKGSMHSRGAAVDLTLVDASGKELDMGTTYDFFGREAHTDYTKLPAKVLDNRRILRQALEAVGFEGIRTEWWHFSYQGKGYGLSDYVWPCE